MRTKTFVLQKVVPVLAAVGAIWYFRDFILHHSFKRVYAYIVNKITKNAVRREKQKCFQCITDLKERIDRDLMILEIGAGSATNLKYLPQNTNLCCLEPNPHFTGYVKDNLRRNSTVVSMEIVCGVAENIPKGDETFDVVISSLVLCTVDDIQKTLTEVYRVLKTGGIFLYIEHVASAEGTWTNSFQKLIAPLHRWVADGCDPSRNIASCIKTSKFSDVQIENFVVKKFPFWLKYGIYGKATK